MKLVYMFALSVGLGGMVPAVIAMKRTSENKLQEPESKRKKINALSKEEVQQLIESCKKGNEKAVVELLDKGGDVNTCNEKGIHLLDLAGKNGHMKIIEILFDRGAKAINGSTLLHFAVQLGHIDLCKSLVGSDANVNRGNKRNSTPLHYVAKGGHKEVCKFLLSMGAHVNAEESYGYTPLHYAAKGGHVGICRILLSNKARVDAKGWYITPLHLAALKGHTDVCAFLLRYGANVNAIEEETKQRSLHYAAEGNSVAICSLLLFYGAYIDEPCFVERSPLRVAVEYNSIDAGAFLLSCGADVNMLDIYGNTHLHEENLSADFCKLLLKYNPNVDFRGNSGQTPLHKAKLEVCKVLLQAGATINMQNDCGITPLYYHIARRCSYKQPKKAKEYCDFFLSKGANMKLLPMPISTTNWFRAFALNSNDKSFTDALLKRKEEEVRHNMLLVVVVKKKIVDDKEINCEKMALGALRSYIANLGGMIPLDLVDKGGNTLLHGAIKAGNFEIAKYIVATFPLLLLKKNNEGNNGLGMLANVHGKYKNDAGYNEFKGACLRIALR